MIFIKSVSSEADFFCLNTNNSEIIKLYGTGVVFLFSQEKTIKLYKLTHELTLKIIHLFKQLFTKSLCISVNHKLICGLKFL